MESSGSREILRRRCRRRTWRSFDAGPTPSNAGFDDALIEEIIDPDVIFEPLRAPVSGTYRGHEGIRQFIADTAESFDVFRFDRSDIRDLGDRVLAIGTLHIRAREGGIETDVPTAGIATYRDGRLIHWKDYGDKSQALQTAGLSE